MDIIKLISIIKSNPTNILGRHSFDVLKPFLDGWYFRSLDEEPNEDVNYEIFGHFFLWLQKKYSIGANLFWPNVIAYYSQDDYSALNNFFELWNKFLEDRNNGLLPPLLEDPIPEGVVIEHYIPQEKYNVTDIVSLLIPIKKRPPLYLGKNSLILLKAFIDGWYFRNPSKDVKIELLDDFHIYLQKHLEMDDKTSWDRILLYYHSDDTLALKFFFELWDEFLASRASVA